MSFSFSTMLKNGSAAQAAADPSYPSETPVAAHPPEFNSTPPAMPQPTHQPTPLPFGGPLFRTVGNDDEQGAPVSASPSPFGNAGPAGGTLLTVGDVLSQLPPDLARASAIPPDHPIQISPQVLRAALSSGQPAISLFELYRVCPGIFQMPVSPDDPRLVPLPASKLPALLAAAGTPSAVPQATHAPAFPFGTPAASPFSAPPASPFAPAAAAAPLSPPPSPSAFPGSPFGAAVSPAQPETSHPSPFQSLLNEEVPSAPAPSSPRGPTPLPPRRPPDQLPAHSIDPAVAPTGFVPQLPPNLTAPASSPFLAPPEPPSPAPPPLPAAAPPPQTTSPFSAPPAMPSTASASPFLPPSPEPVSPPSVPAAAAPSNNPRTHRPATAPLVALLQGHSSDELGFDPAMVPSWITTAFHAGMIAELHEMERPSLDLGTIIDGITDVGFRNVLQSARRGAQIAIPMQALTPMEPSPIPEPSNFPTTTEKRTLRVGTEAEAAHRIEPGNPFAAVPEAPPPTPVAAEAPTDPTPPPAFEAPPAQAAWSAPISIPVPNPNPDFRAESSAATRPPSKFIQPAPGALFAFGESSPAMPPAPPEPFSQTNADQPTPPPSQPTSPFGSSVRSAALDPFAIPQSAPAAPASPHAEGFSSRDLLGQAPSFSEPPPPPLFPTDPDESFAGHHELPPFPDTAPFAAHAAETQLPPSTSHLQPPAHSPGPPEHAEQPPALPTSWPPAPETRSPEPERTPPLAAPHSEATPAPTPPAKAHAATGKVGGIDLSTLDTTSSEQLLLRALLASDTDLSLADAIQKTAELRGLEACILVNGNDVMAHCATDSTEAQAFRSQAADLARSLRTLGPLIGIDGAETFTLKSNDRVITFCSPGTILLGVLHGQEPSLGIRDKVTLIARQLDTLINTH